MVDRIKLGNHKSSLIQTELLPDSYSAFKSLVENGGMKVDISPRNTLDDDAGITVVGTALNKANILADDTAEKLGLTDDECTPNDAFNALAEAVQVRELTISTGWTAGTGNFYKDVTLDGVTADSELEVAVNIAPNQSSLAKAINKAFGMIYSAEPMTDKIRFYALTLPTVAIPVTVKGA